MLKQVQHDEIGFNARWFWLPPTSVRAELVEAPSFFRPRKTQKKRSFERLRTNGSRLHPLNRARQFHQHQAGNDQHRRQQPQRRHRLAQHHDPDHESAHGADSGPHRIGGAER